MVRLPSTPDQATLQPYQFTHITPIHLTNSALFRMLKPHCDLASISDLDVGLRTSTTEANTLNFCSTRVFTV